MRPLSVPHAKCLITPPTDELPSKKGHLLQRIPPRKGNTLEARWQGRLERNRQQGGGISLRFQGNEGNEGNEQGSGHKSSNYFWPTYSTSMINGTGEIVESPLLNIQSTIVLTVVQNLMRMAVQCTQLV